MVRIVVATRDCFSFFLYLSLYFLTPNKTPMKEKYWLAFLMLAFCFSCYAQQRITVNAGPVIDHSQVAADSDLPKVIIETPFSTRTYVSTMMFNTKTRQAFDGFGYSRRSFNFSVLDNFVTYNGTKQISAEVFTDKVSLLSFVSRDGKTYVF